MNASAKPLSKIRFTVAYDGTGYCGWQKQKHQGPPSVAQILEERLEEVFHQKISLFASGRTDAGVHALNQVCHFSVHRDVRPGTKWDFCWAMNSQLPRGIVVKKAWLAPEDFHATLSATHKTYRYLILNRPRASAHLNRYMHWERRPIDIEHLQESSKFLLGKHDFKAFQSMGTEVKTTTRKIYRAEWQWRTDEVLQFTVTGNGFLKQMVRNLVGTSLMLQRKGQNPSKIKEIMESRDRKLAGAPAPAEGLYLLRVYYPQDLDNRCIEL